MSELKIHTALPKPAEIVAVKATNKFVAETQSVMRAAVIKGEPISKIDTMEKVREPKIGEGVKNKEPENCD